MQHTCFISSIQLSHNRHLKCDLAEVKCQLLVGSWLDFSDTSVEELNSTGKKKHLSNPGTHSFSVCFWFNLADTTLRNGGLPATY